MSKKKISLEVRYRDFSRDQLLNVISELMSENSGLRDELSDMQESLESLIVDAPV
jgi:hypothetical protein